MREQRNYRYCRMNITLAVMEIAAYALCLMPGSRIYALWRCAAVPVLVKGEYLRLVTSIFLHANLSHLFSNLLVQVLMGNAVERNLGHLRYLILFLLSGIGGNLVSVLYDRAQGVNIYSVGASGAVFGVMGALFVLIVKGRKKLRTGSSLLARAAFAVFYAVYAGFKTPYTDNAAHLGGLAFGVLLGVILSIPLEDVDLQDLR